MIESCLRAGGLDALACGNIGLPFPEAAVQDRDVLVVEVSSFQLALQESFHPSISVLLNVAPDHLDWHGSLEAYVDAKRRIYARQSEHRRAHRQPRRPRLRPDLARRRRARSAGSEADRRRTGRSGSRATS